jgi:hypothetical protein
LITVLPECLLYAGKITPLLIMSHGQDVDLQVFRSFQRTVGVLVSCLVLTTILGCGGGPARLRPPDIDPQSAAEEAIGLYDKDGDGALSAEELKASPGLLVAIKSYDLDSDGKISQDEIVDHWQFLVDRKVALTRLAASVNLDGRPLTNATVHFVPDPYLGGEVTPAKGKTGRRGSTAIIVEPEGVSENQRNIRGLQYGTYRVEITHPNINIPSNYNTNTTLGYDSQPGNASVSFDLKSR